MLDEIPVRTPADLLRQADALIAEAVRMIRRSGGVSDGHPMEFALTMHARLMPWEASGMMRASSTMDRLPRLTDAFDRGVVSWSQVRAILREIERVPADRIDEIDHVIARHAESLVAADPDRLVGLVSDAAARLRPDLATAREDRAVRSSFFAVQPRLDGGSSFYGEADAEATAVYLSALDASAERPQHADKGGPGRARQHFDAFLAICEQSLSRSALRTRPQPRLLATVDLLAFDGDADGAMRLLQSTTGRPARLTRVAAETLLCDATIVPVLTVGGRPIAVGEEATRVTRRMRRALIARDGGCRFPGCHVPVAWTDVHHLVPGIGQTVDEMALHCRRHHRRLHDQPWTVAIHPDATMTYTLRGRSYVSNPRHRAPPGSPP